MQTVLAVAFVLMSSTIQTLSEPNSRRLDTIQDRAVNPYAPTHTVCPSTPLYRPANGISSRESSYVNARKPLADAALRSFLGKNSPNFGKPSTYPTVALATSGGGLRSLLIGAGVHQALDVRDGGNSSVAGLYQALTYETALSGGGWLLGSLAGNNWPTVTSLRSGLWERTFSASLLLPENFATGDAYAHVAADLVAKQAAGFSPTVNDVYGRLLGYMLLRSVEGGEAQEYSTSVDAAGNFSSHNVPFPIITATSFDMTSDECARNINWTQYEISPYEFGSWDAGVKAFAQTQFLGSTTGSDSGSRCLTNFDNVGYVMGTTSDLFVTLCDAIRSPSRTLSSSGNGMTSPSDIVGAIEKTFGNITLSAAGDASRDLWAVYPNPFRGSVGSTSVSNMRELRLADGGESFQNDPIWPVLNGGRAADVLIVNDNGADTSNNFPNGSAIYNTYLRARAAGLSKMPAIPDTGTFMARGLNSRPTFFGCDDTNVITIVYVPNKAYSFNSGQNTFRVEYTPNDTDAMIANGVQVGAYGGNGTFGLCVACALMKKTGGGLPDECTGCFSSFCYN